MTERLAYERAVHNHRLRNEISQAKREANFISYNFEKSQKLKKNKAISSGDIEASNKANFIQNYRQRKTEREILEENSRKKLRPNGNSEEDESDKKTFLKNLFGT